MKMRAPAAQLVFWPLRTLTGDGAIAPPMTITAAVELAQVHGNVADVAGLVDRWAPDGLRAHCSEAGQQLEGSRDVRDGVESGRRRAANHARRGSGHSEDDEIRRTEHCEAARGPWTLRGGSAVFSPAHGRGAPRGLRAELPGHRVAPCQSRAGRARIARAGRRDDAAEARQVPGLCARV